MQTTPLVHLHTHSTFGLVEESKSRHRIYQYMFKTINAAAVIVALFLSSKRCAEDLLTKNIIFLIFFFVTVVFCSV